MVRAIMILPFNALVTIPVLVLWASGFRRWEAPWAGVSQILGGMLLAFALYGMLRTQSLFLRVGEGTPAPWDPPRKLVVEGPYRHVRNPMISSVVAGLASEGLLFNSVWLLGWAAVFMLLNFIYMRVFEEPGLVDRFGEEYEEYRRHVPRWVPRLKPWRG